MHGRRPRVCSLYAFMPRLARLDLRAMISGCASCRVGVECDPVGHGTAYVCRASPTSLVGLATAPPGVFALQSSTALTPPFSLVLEEVKFDNRELHSRTGAHWRPNCRRVSPRPAMSNVKPLLQCVRSESARNAIGCISSNRSSASQHRCRRVTRRLAQLRSNARFCSWAGAGVLPQARVVLILSRACEA